MAIEFHRDVEQGSERWHQLRCGILTASEMNHIITPTLRVASNEKERTHLYELLAQRLTGFVEPSYISDDMLRGLEDEELAVARYREEYDGVARIGFITNDDLGFPIGYSPDGLVSVDGTIEVKSRVQKYQVQTILAGTMPDDYRIQVQTGLLVTGRAWCDFISYCGGLPMVTIRVPRDEAVIAAIVDAATQFEERLQAAKAAYTENLFKLRHLKTRRIDRDGDIL